MNGWMLFAGKCHNDFEKAVRKADAVRVRDRRAVRAVPGLIPAWAGCTDFRRARLCRTGLCAARHGL